MDEVAAAQSYGRGANLVTKDGAIGWGVDAA